MPVWWEMDSQVPVNTDVSPSTVDGETNYLFYCPHCAGPIVLPQSWIGCGIFRHAVNPFQNTSVDPHASEAECRAAMATGRYRGCGRPFTFDGARLGNCDYADRPLPLPAYYSMVEYIPATPDAVTEPTP